MRKNLPYSLFFAGIIALFLYSFTQVDLGLTLTRASFWQKIQVFFQHIGYFQRPLSTLIFLLIISSLFIIYAIFIKLSLAGKIDRKKVWIVILVSSVLLSFSYNAFSYDLFNNIFDAKIVTFYHQNPYLHKALDYPSDPMLSFMHWTHRTYPYGPVNLILTVPLSFLGFNYFLITFFLFKFLNTAFYLGSCCLIEKLLRKERGNLDIFGLVFFALNPLVIIEVLVSSHNDIFMIFFALLGIYFLFFKKHFYSYFWLLFGALTKFVTAILLIPFLLKTFGFLKKQTSDLNSFSSLCLVFLIAVSFFVLLKLEAQPWYFLWFVPFLALVKPRIFLIYLTIGISFGLLLRYSIFLFQGEWNGIANQFKLIVTVITPLLFISLYFLVKSGKKLLKIV